MSSSCRVRVRVRVRVQRFRLKSRGVARAGFRAKARDVVRVRGTGRGPAGPPLSIHY